MNASSAIRQPSERNVRWSLPCFAVSLLPGSCVQIMGRDVIFLLMGRLEHSVIRLDCGP
ncbi:hypothetical protein Krac_4061 [Ktedonobacter racemifer DSM 44963]|uniref:Uncharacterized protein n=1 Tax=Ktedonobacter racemifer DSM 44963 TaxID=485913 RepID=D6TXT1_KTERA|nr:hypothetical protein Krac_4061 [Ktedonobacter racemifer DSM 44963]